MNGMSIVIYNHTLGVYAVYCIYKHTYIYIRMNWILYNDKHIKSFGRYKCIYIIKTIKIPYMCICTTILQKHTYIKSFMYIIYT